MSHDLKFGTSGLRGLVRDLDGPPANDYTRAFLKVLLGRGTIAPGSPVLIGRDLRSSSPSIAARVAQAIVAEGLEPLDCGALATPALALAAMSMRVPAVMVTGSHIPDDRNGLKFYRPDGEIDKRDEVEIVQSHAGSASGSEVDGSVSPKAHDALSAYRERYLRFFPERALEGVRVGVYQHSSVARDLFTELLSAMGAHTVALGRADRFIPVDTEALRSEDVALLKQWSAQGLDAIVSTDGDADRPLIADEQGAFVRGDLVGAITAAALGADAIVTPVTSNSALEACGSFARVVRTKVGSPYVIEGFEEARRGGATRIVGFEANGGVLLASSVEAEGRTLEALPTRDAFLPIAACLVQIARHKRPLSAIAAEFGFRALASDRLTETPQALSAAFLDRLAQPQSSDHFAQHGGIARIDTRDGMRLFLGSGDVLHFRPSGNAPELRCYAEAADQERADALVAWGLDLARRDIETNKTRLSP